MCARRFNRFKKERNFLFWSISVRLRFTRLQPIVLDKLYSIIYTLFEMTMSGKAGLLYGIYFIHNGN